MKIYMISLLHRATIKQRQHWIKYISQSQSHKYIDTMHEYDTSWYACGAHCTDIIHNKILVAAKLCVNAQWKCCRASYAHLATVTTTKVEMLIFVHSKLVQLLLTNPQTKVDVQCDKLVTERSRQRLQQSTLSSYLSQVAHFNLPNLHLAPQSEVTPFDFCWDLRAIVWHCLRDPTFRHFSRIPTCDRQAHDYGIYCASIASHGKNRKVPKIKKGSHDSDHAPFWVIYHQTAATTQTRNLNITSLIKKTCHTSSTILK